MREFPSRKRRANLSQLGPCGMGSSRAHAPNPPAIRLEPRRGSVMQPRRDAQRPRLGPAPTTPGRWQQRTPAGCRQESVTRSSTTEPLQGSRFTGSEVVQRPRGLSWETHGTRAVPWGQGVRSHLQQKPRRRRSGALPCPCGISDLKFQISDPSSVSPTLPLCDLRGSEGWPHSEEAGQSARAPLGLWLSICAHRRHLRFPLLWNR